MSCYANQECKWLDYIMRANKETTESAKNASCDAKRAEVAACRAEQQAETGGFLNVSIDDDGMLILTKSENMSNINLEMDKDGYLIARTGE